MTRAPAGQMCLLAGDSTARDAAYMATLSADRQYRYSLHRVWEREKGLVMFVGLNPSTADEHVDDPTIRRCIGFARSWGFGGIVMVNLYAYRATDPRELARVEDPIGNPANDSAIRELAAACDLIVLAWGAHKVPEQIHRTSHVRWMLRDVFAGLYVLGFTAGGEPRHPLYMPAKTVPQHWRWRGGVDA